MYCFTGKVQTEYSERGSGLWLSSGLGGLEATWGLSRAMISYGLQQGWGLLVLT